MRLAVLLLSLLIAIEGCAGDQRSDMSSAESEPNAVAQHEPTAPKSPVLQFFSSTDSVMDVVDGAGCGYSAPGVGGDSSLFAFSEDGIIRLHDRLEVMKLVGEGAFTDSTSETHWENPRYRLHLQTVTDSTVEGGVIQHGEITVEEKATGGKQSLAIVGWCGC